jgi:site-specific DNA-cytosine methylase
MALKASDYKRPYRAYTGYRVVKMTTRCLARFQSFPDSYVLPRSGIAAKIIGNAVPPLLYQKIIEQLV